MLKQTITSYKDLRRAAMDLLARREHSQKELMQKLTKRCDDKELIRDVIEKLVADNLQSDKRFAEAYMRMRRNRGYGPNRIRVELQERGVNESLTSSLLSAEDNNWLEYLHEVWNKKFNGQMPKDANERAKQQRFLQYRGFTADQIREIT